MIYCMSVWIGIWDIPGQLDDGNKLSMNRNDMRKLQVLQNKVLRLETNLDRSVPTSTLLEKSGSLSVHQLGAYHTAVQVFKISQDKKPAYILTISSQNTPNVARLGRINFEPVEKVEKSRRLRILLYFSLYG